MCSLFAWSFEGRSPCIALLRGITFVFVLCSCASSGGSAASVAAQGNTGDESSSVPESLAPPGFWAHWGDGRAEIATYQLTQPRYGEMRRGEAVLIFVTETFTAASMVKSDGGHSDEFPVIKLNEVRDFQTGIYDYNGMTSTFLRLDGGLPMGMPAKVGLSVQEWCGHAYDQLVSRGSGFQRSLHSYFDGEADLDEQIPAPLGGISADAMPILVRGLTGGLLTPGEERIVPWLGTLLDARLDHVALRWSQATIRRSESPVDIEVPAGRFVANVYSARTVSGDSTWWVEAAPPYRLLRWTRSTGEQGTLVGSTRTAYWKKQAEGDEQDLLDLGLEPRRWPGAAAAESGVPDVGSSQE